MPEARPSTANSPTRVAEPSADVVPLFPDRATPAADLPATVTPAQWHNIKAQLDLILIALESLVGIGSEAILKAATQLKLDATIGDRVALWRLRQSSPLRSGSGGRKKLDVEEARSLVLITACLARDHQESIRRAVALLEQLAERGRPPHHAALLGDYLDRFTEAYRDRMADGDDISSDLISDLALKLLIDLLFYSSSGGDRRLWLALLERANSIQKGE